MEVDDKVAQKIDTDLKISPADLAGACYRLKMET